MSASLALFLIPAGVACLGYLSYRHNHFGVNQRASRQIIRPRALSKAELAKQRAYLLNHHISTYPAYSPDQEPKIIPVIDYMPAKIGPIHYQEHKPRLRETHDLESQIKAVFVRFNPDIDPEGLDFEAFIDHTLTAKQNIAEFRSKDNQFSVFKWND